MSDLCALCQERPQESGVLCWPCVAEERLGVARGYAEEAVRAWDSCARLRARLARVIRIAHHWRDAYIECIADDPVVFVEKEV